MIKVFVSDIDGCLSVPYRAYDLERLAELSRLAAAAGAVGDSETRPALTICSGRPYSYVEAMTQVLDVQIPVLFESGGGMFDPQTARITWNPHFTGAVEEDLEQMRRFLIEECLPGTSLSYDYGKRTQAGVVGPVADDITQQLPRVKDYIADQLPHLCAYHTEVSIDVLPQSITKEEGLRWLGETLGVETDEMAYIGDSNGDLDALALVGRSFAPANATDAVCAQVDCVTEGAVVEGTLSAYRQCICYNRRQVPTAS